LPSTKGTGEGKRQVEGKEGKEDEEKPRNQRSPLGPTGGEEGDGVNVESMNALYEISSAKPKTA
jgi:hypothetical protein